jgi:hypothetical protein
MPPQRPYEPQRYRNHNQSFSENPAASFGNLVFNVTQPAILVRFMAIDCEIARLRLDSGARILANVTVQMKSLVNYRYLIASGIIA